MKSMRFLTIFLILFNFSVSAADYFSQDLGWKEHNLPILSSLAYPEQVEKIYQENEAYPIWTNSTSRLAFEQQLEVISRSGISPLFSQRLAAIIKYREQGNWFEYELLATDTLLIFLSYAERVTVIGKQWFFDGKKIATPLPLPSDDALTLLKKSIVKSELLGFVQSYLPEDASYSQIMIAYNDLRKKESDNIQRYPYKGVIKPGDLLVDRRLLIERLALGVSVDTNLIDKDSALYDKALVETVKRFQRAHGLKTDGIIGSNTAKWLNLSVKSRLTKLAINAERSRLWPKQKDSMVLVNIPGFNMTYWDSGNAIFSSKVVVGRVDRPTPLMSLQLDSVILNPTWNVPRTIMVEDILPKVIKDINYFSQRRIDVIKKWGAVNIIDPNDIDWLSVEPETFPYKMRQQSGSHNALGLYKFNTPNAEAIFMHDTPSQYLFNKDSRAFSSGCIRVQDASIFASKILKTQNIDKSRLKASLDESNKLIALKRKIPVHIIYQTIWYEHGSVQYRDDIYSFDAQLKAGS